MLPEELKPGMTFQKEGRDYLIVIESIDRKVINFKKSDRPRILRMSTSNFITSIQTNGWIPQVTKPLDQAFKQLDIQLCSHRNIREDRYFSAMVYKTCKDCGKALN